jgi:hypothetical protein
MLEIFNATFESGRMPADWIIERAEATFDGRVMQSGLITAASFVVTGSRWRTLRIETELEPAPDSVVECTDGTVAIVLDLISKTSRITAYGGAVLAEAVHDVPPKQGPHLLAMEFDHNHLRFFVDGREVATAKDPRPAPRGGLMRISFWNNCRVHRVRALAEGAVQEIHNIKPAKDFLLEVNVDFFDDLIHAPFTAVMFDRLFAEFKSWGTRRVHWIYYGGARRGWWARAPRGVAENARRTMENAGEIFPAAVSAAHRHGIELYGLIKPFDMGFWHNVGESDPRAKTWGRMPRIGGPVGWIADFAADRRDLCMARKPAACGPAKNKFFTRIDLVKEDAAAAAFSVNDLNLFVSDDNTTYRPYAGPMTREEKIEDYPAWEHTASGGRPAGAARRSRIMRLKDLNIRSGYFAVGVQSRAGSFANTLVNLIHVFGPEGEERRLTYGLHFRRKETIKGAVAQPVDAGGIVDSGVDFDVWPGTPTAVFPGFNVWRSRLALDSRDGLLAIARGKDRNPVACLSPSFPEAREWWLDWVKDCLDAGADGMELRVRNHHSPFTWTEFGFEEPVVRAFRERYGVDLLATDDFDRPAWERLRGEAYTAFYRDAKRLAASYGKKLGLHVSQTMCLGPEFGSAMAVHWDWQTWLQEDLADSVTMKEVFPYSRFGEEVMACTRSKNIPVIFCPYANNLWSAPGGVETCARRIRLAREAGFSGFQYYECASVVRATEDGRIVMEQPALRDLFKSEFIR